MATHSSILAWRTPWTEEPRGSSVQQRVGHNRETNVHAGLNVDGGLDGSSWVEVGRLSVGAGCQLRCLSSSRRQAPASSHSEGAKAPKGSKTGQGSMRKRLSSLSLHPIRQCPIAENKSCSQDQIPGMEDKIHLLIGKLAVILQKDMHPGVARIWVYFAIITICQVLRQWGLFPSLSFVNRAEESQLRITFRTGRSVPSLSKPIILAVFTEAGILKIAGSSRLLHKTLIIHNSVIQPDVQNAWPHVELLSHKEFTGWLFTPVWLLMLILTDGITNILAICTEFYEKSIVVSLKWLKCHSYKEHGSSPLLKENENLSPYKS